MTQDAAGPNNRVGGFLTGIFDHSLQLTLCVFRTDITLWLLDRLSSNVKLMIFVEYVEYPCKSNGILTVRVRYCETSQLNSLWQIF